ncbi:hypothetical protein [Oryza sativa Japonica Group]|uniref:Uncharacterized protein n=4 Tax=Oryza TaxID=4527 RepID=B9EWL6_ORYSJ|nr:uncharacterized protein LOC107278089 [Oryza sativa Japonica Group]EEC72219.1 hypothetical protein OsI_05321 [Oryza sativa Indica Group]EEE56057.1 hypothetical protein OsJ_04865 [Oryza sativa Japonica Group]BAD87236.1 hypothetical protein [Oryza sativa Japonica Group]
MRRSIEAIHVRTDYDDCRRKGHGHGAMRMQDELARTKTRWPTPAQLEMIERMKEEEEDDEIVASDNRTPSVVETKVQVPEIVEQNVVERDERLRTSDDNDDYEDEPIVRRDGHGGGGGGRRAYGDIGGYHGSKGRWPREPEVEKLEREKEMLKYGIMSKPTTTRKVKIVHRMIRPPNQYGAAGSAPPPTAGGGHQPATSSYLRPIYYHY